jgi:uncharacterized membrane protein HdeD (DUF308 family)
MLLIEMLLGCLFLLSGMLCVVHALWADPTAECAPIGYSAGSLFAVMGLVLFLNAVNSCASLSACLAVIGPQ